MNIERVAWEAVSAGEKVLLSMFQKLKPSDIGFKAHHEIVTKADRASNDAIIAVLRRHTPEFDILSEESAPRRRSNCIWILDPLDGTTNYAAQIPLWGISLAMTCDSEIELGAISLPLVGERYLAIRGKGAWMIANKKRKRLRVSKTNALPDALGLVCYGRNCGKEGCWEPALSRLNAQSRGQRRLGAAVVESTWVATGRADYALLYGLHPWDVAAGALLVKEAGGDVRATDGTPWTLGEPNVLFSTPKLTKKILSTFR